MKHRHHIVPRHAGGTDDKSNIAWLTVEEHAEAHRLLWLEHGRWQDRIAWLALSGRIGKEEVIRERAKAALGNYYLTHEFHKPWLGKKRYPETVEKLRVAATGKAVSAETREKLHKVGMKLKGIPKTAEHKAALSNAAKKRPTGTCTHCGAVMQLNTIAR